MKKLALMGAAAALALLPVQAHAVTGAIPFNGTVADTCTITAINPGTLDTNTAFNQIGSGHGSGASGGATITTNATSFTVGVDAPTAWATSPAGTPTTTFTSTYSTTGANVIATTSADTPMINAGVTNVTVDMNASTAGAYPSGTYSAVVTLRCE